MSTDEYVWDNIWGSVDYTVLKLARYKADICIDKNNNGNIALIFMNVRNTVRVNVWANVGDRVWEDVRNRFNYGRGLPHMYSQLEAAYAAMEKI
jgi:hypothetical protein